MHVFPFISFFFCTQLWWWSKWGRTKQNGAIVFWLKQVLCRPGISLSKTTTNYQMGLPGQVCSATIISSILTANELQVKRITLLKVAFFLCFISSNCKLQSFFNNLPLKSSARQFVWPKWGIYSHRRCFNARRDRSNCCLNVTGYVPDAESFHARPGGAR